MVTLNNKNNVSGELVGSIEAELFFSVSPKERSAVYVVGYECAFITQESRKVEVANGRFCQEKFSVGANGFELIKFASELTNVRDIDAVRRIFRPEAEQILKRLTGASRVLMFNHIVRDSSEAPLGDHFAAPRFCHVGHDQATYESIIRTCLSPGEADALLGRRWAAYSMWKPMASVKNLPLAVCDARTVFEENLVPNDQGADASVPLQQKSGLGVTFNSKQRWYYFPDMTAEEALVLKIWDTDIDLPQWVAHSAFVDPTSKSDANPRVVLDGRFIAFY